MEYKSFERPNTDLICQWCSRYVEHEKEVLGLFVIANGKVQVRRFCTVCGGRSLQSVSQKGLTVSKLPVMASSLPGYEHDLEYAKRHVQELVEAGAIF